MIDSRLLLTDLSASLKKLGRKAVPEATILKAQGLILKKNKGIKHLEELRNQKNKLSKNIAQLMAQKQPVDKAKAKVSEIKQEIDKETHKLLLLTEDLKKCLLHIPNFPDDKAPEDNIEIQRGNWDPKLLNSQIPPHWEIMEELGIFDQKRAGKITGSMFAILKGSGAKLLRSLISFALDLFSPDYTEFIVPSLVNSASFQGTGQLPKFAEEAYHIEKDDLWAIPTGEVPLTALHQNELLEESLLPLKYMTYSPCFRREAGAAGQRNRGLQRLHEFHKVELVKICSALNSDKELESLLQDALKPIKQLKLPYRVLDLCARDLTFSSARTYDIEVYSPGTKSWMEVSSVGLFTDYQSRRLGIRYRLKDKKTNYPHTLNGSGLASPRVLAGILENYREGKNKVKVPEVLVKYMGQDYL